jgi:hypothetical protein
LNPHRYYEWGTTSPPITDKDEFLPERTEVKVVTGYFKLKKKVNELARQGYRLAFTHFEIAMMYRHRDTTAPVSYIWLDSRKKKSFEQELTRLQDRGAIYLFRILARVAIACTDKPPRLACDRGTI